MIKKVNKNPIQRVLIVFTLCFMALSLQTAEAQIALDFEDDVDDSTPAAPIDGLLGLGIAAGAWYGIRKTSKEKHKN